MEERIHYRRSGGVKGIIGSILKWFLIIFFAVYTLFPLLCFLFPHSKQTMSF